MDLKVRWQADRIGLAVLLASGIAARLYLIHWHAHIIPDDAYYYLEISRNLAMGRGFTFDGLAPTNGFHPLWCLILSPMWFVPIPQPIAPIKLILAASSILYIVSVDFA